MTNESYFHQNESYMKALEDDINYAKSPIPSLILTELDEYKTILSKCNESTIPLKTINFLSTFGTKTFKLFDINKEQQKAITYNNKEKDKLDISEKKTKTEKKKNNNSNNNNNDDEKDSPFFDDIDSCNSNKDEKDTPFFDDINSYF